MGRADEILSEQFNRWEERGRGWKVWPGPVHPEPPFRPFPGFKFPRPDVEVDDGRKPGLFASLMDSVEKALNPKPPIIPEVEEAEPEPEPLERDSLIELQTLLPANLDIKDEFFADFLSQLAVCREPVAFELLGTAEGIKAQFVSHPKDASLLKRQLAGYFPEVAFLPTENTLIDTWAQSHDEALLVEFGLEKEFLLPLATGRKLDPFVGLVGAMSDLQPGELALFQVLFQAAEHDWKESALRLILDAEGKPIFVNREEWVEQAETKFSSPLHAAVVRIAIKAEEFGRTVEIARELAFALRIFANTEGNALVPLANEDYAFEIHEEDVLLRQSHRGGMLLNAEELMGFVHFPASEVRSPHLTRQIERTKSAPASVTGDANFFLGQNAHLGKTELVGLTPEQRVRHAHVVGVPGTGKSNFIFNLIEQDIKNGEGLAVFDPHGDLIEKILGCIPKERFGDVVLLDPSDEEYSVPFNVLSAHSDLEKRLIASDLSSVFQRLSTSWGDQMTSVLNNAILAFLESSQGGTLSDMRRFLIEPGYRNQFLKTVNDPDIVYYWQKGFPLLSGNRSIGPLLTRLEMFLSPKPVRYMVSQKENRLDFSAIMDTGKIFLAKLSQGKMGRENSSLMGSLLMAKFHLAAMSRANVSEAARRHFFMYLDEAHNFATPSMVEILTGARKYRVGLLLAHQDLSQLERVKEIGSAVLACYTRVVFRVGDSDAKKLSEGFAHFEAEDLQNLEIGQAVCKVERSDHDFNLSVPFFEDPDPIAAETIRQEVIRISRARYALSRAEIEAALLAKLDLLVEPPQPPEAKSVTKPVPKVSEKKAAEVPKETVSEMEKPPPVLEIAPEQSVAVILSVPIEAPTVSVEPKAAPPPIQEEKGIGGHQHNLIRERVEAVARELGYCTSREKPTETGQMIDLALEKHNQVIACEISITTTVDHEVGNVSKCLKAGCQHVAVIGTNATKIAKIQAAVTACVAGGDLPRIGYYLPEQFIEHLKSLKPPADIEPTTTKTKRGKYTITRRAAKLTAEEAREREAHAHQMLAQTMKRKS